MRVSVVSCAFLLCVMISTPVMSTPTDDARRAEVATKARAIFKNTANHCQAVVEVTKVAVEKAGSVANLIEDLKLLFVGESLQSRRTGPHYIGKTPGARGDKGFKASLKDNSPQVEHLIAAIYIGKTLPPGSAEGIAVITEIAEPLATGGKMNTADVLLYTIGSDAGQRLSGSNYSQLPNVITRTVCE